MALAQNDIQYFWIWTVQILAINVIRVTETQDAITHWTPPPQPGFIRYLWAQLYLNCLSKSNDTSNRDMRSCVEFIFTAIIFFFFSLSAADSMHTDNNYLNSVSITIPVDMTGGCEFPGPDWANTHVTLQGKGQCFLKWWVLPSCNSLLTLLWLTAGTRWHLSQLEKPFSPVCAERNLRNSSSCSLSDNILYHLEDYIKVYFRPVFLTMSVLCMSFNHHKSLSLRMYLICEWKMVHLTISLYCKYFK